MKIGTVCELTKLSDRAIRHYIDEGLLYPDCTKNYLGRKSFDFSDADVHTLQNISVLRKYGFSIPEIKAIMDDPAQSIPIIQKIQQDKLSAIQKETELLHVLLTLNRETAYTIPSLAEALRTPSLDDIQPPKDPEESALAGAFRFWFWLICCPVLLFIICSLLSSLLGIPRKFLFVKFYPYAPEFLRIILAGITPFLFASAMLVISSRRCRRKRMLHTILAGTIFICYFLVGGFCLLDFMLSSEIHFPIYSETEDPADYLNLGSLEHEYEEVFLLFPAEIPDHAISQNGQPHPETTRYYNFTEDRWDRRFEIFAQWTLSQEELDSEKARLLAVFSETAVIQAQWGNWIFWSFTDRNPVLRLQEGNLYTRERALNYYVVFAYREDEGLVRYLVSYSDNHDNEPGFLALDWA